MPARARTEPSNRRDHRNPRAADGWTDPRRPQGKRYLVTGCAGFIGANVTQRLLAAGHTVVGVDNLNRAYDPRLKQWRLNRLQGHGRFHFERFDITHSNKVNSLFSRLPSRGPARDQERPFAGVIHLAARAGVRPSVARPRLYYRANAEGTLNLLEACRRSGVTKFVLASTSSLYGSCNPVPYREDADTNHPLSPYAASKKAAETLAYTYYYLHGLDVTVLRFFTVYGPAGRPDMSIFRFIDAIARRRPIVVFGDGTQERDFTYVDDIARGALAALDLRGFDVINLGSDRPVRLSVVIDQVAALLRHTPRIQHRPAHPADVLATWADIQTAQRRLHWSPQVSLEDGLRHTVQWHQKHWRTIDRSTR